MAGRGPDERRAGARLDRGEVKASSVRCPEERPERRTAAVERREARVPGNNGTRHLPRCQTVTSALPALRSLMRMREGRRRRTPRRPNHGDDESRLLECACLHAGCLTIESEMKRTAGAVLHPPLEGEGRERSERGGVSLLATSSPHPAASHSLGVDPPPPGEGRHRASGKRCKTIAVPSRPRPRRS